jgi:hypothetical protein
MAEIPSKELKDSVLGYLVATVLLTVMVTDDTVELFPALSMAVAVRVWEALVRVVVSKGTLILPDVEVANTLPSTKRVTNLSPEVTCPVTLGSLAVAEKVMVPLSVPVDGDVMDAVGGVVSGAGVTVGLTDTEFPDCTPRPLSMLMVVAPLTDHDRVVEAP